MLIGVIHAVRGLHAVHFSQHCHSTCHERLGLSFSLVELEESPLHLGARSK
jgi:hypothetical protein